MWQSRYGSLPLALLFVLLALRESTRGADFLIVENVKHLVFYNKYQQLPSEQDRSILKPQAAMKILKRDDVLGDGFTRYMQVEMEGEVFYLLKESSGNLARSGPLGSVQIYTGTTPLQDTIRIITPINSGLGNLRKGERLFRIFRNQQGTYVRRLNGTPFYGWVDLASGTEGRAWEVVRNTGANPELTSVPRTTMENIRTKLNAANSVLNRLFLHFNKEAGQTRQSPQWKLTTSGAAILCTLDGVTNGESFAESTLYLTNEIETLLLGTQLQVSHSPGRIEITPQ